MRAHADWRVWTMRCAAIGVGLLSAALAACSASADPDAATPWGRDAATLGSAPDAGADAEVGVDASIDGGRPDGGEDGAAGLSRPPSSCADDPGFPPRPDVAHWSIGSYPGWVQRGAGADEVRAELEGHAVFTHVMHFAMYPTPEGELRFGDGDSDIWSPEQACAAVSGAHQAGLPIIVVLGGEGEGHKFVDATADAAARATLIDNTIRFIDTYGYDGVSIDWEEDVVDDQLVSLLRELRAALEPLSPRPLLMVDVLSGLVDPATSARMEPFVDSVNIMSYWSDWREEVEVHVEAGLSPSLLVVGVGLSADYHDTTVERVEEKIELVRDRGLRGVEAWQIGDLVDGRDDPRLEAIGRL